MRLGARTLQRAAAQWVHAPQRPVLEDGLSADDWSSLSRRFGRSPVHGARSYNQDGIRRILDAGLEFGEEEPQASSP